MDAGGIVDRGSRVLSGLDAEWVCSWEKEGVGVLAGKRRRVVDGMELGWRIADLVLFRRQE